MTNSDDRMDPNPVSSRPRNHAVAAVPFEAIAAARGRLRGEANHTPVMTSRTLDQRVGARVFLKCENFQRVGAFKFRGAFNAISQLGEEERARGVLTFSSGNHAQAVALVGRLLGVRTTIVMPEDASPPKRAATEAYGAEVVYYDSKRTTRREVAQELLSKKEYMVIPPFDHPDVIAGQGTVGWEILEQAGPLDLLLVPVGGGGLLSGCAIAVKALQESCSVVGIEPELADDAARSFRSGVLQRVENPQTIADGTRPASLGENYTFPLIQHYVDDIRTVGEDAIKEAVRFLHTRMKLVVEPSGALGVAALLSGAVEPGERTGVVLSGGNIDPAVLKEIL